MAWRRAASASGVSVNSSLMNWPWLRWRLTARSISAAGFMYSRHSRSSSSSVAVFRLSSSSRWGASVGMAAKVSCEARGKCKKQTSGAQGVWRAGARVHIDAMVHQVGAPCALLVRNRSRRALQADALHRDGDGVALLDRLAGAVQHLHHQAV